MKKTLVNVIHPNLDNASIVNKRWVDELKKHPEKFEIRNLFVIFTKSNLTERLMSLKNKN
jgi:hypothetical protein